MTNVDEHKPSVLGRIAVIVAAAGFYSYPFWTALGNLINLPAYFAEQFGVGPEQVPWGLLIAGVAVPVIVFVVSILVTWRRGAGSMALVLTTGFAVVNVIALSILAFEKEIEIRIVIDFLTGL